MRQGNQDLHIENAFIIFFSIFNNSMCFLLIILKVLNLSLPLSEAALCDLILYYIIEKSNETENVQLNSLFTKGELLCLSCTNQSSSCMSGGERRKETDKIFFYFKHWNKTCLKVAFQCSIFSAYFRGSDLIRVTTALNSILKNTFYFIYEE